MPKKFSGHIISATFRLLEEKSKKHFLILTLFMVFFSIVELTIVTLIVPFISALQKNMALFHKYEFIHRLVDISSPKTLVLHLGFFLVFLFTLKAVLDWVMHFYMCRLTQKIKNNLTLKLYKGYLNLKYIDFQRFNTNTFTKNCLINTMHVVYVIFKTSEIIRDGLLVLVLVFALLNQNFLISLYFISAIGIMGFLFFRLMKGRQYQAGKLLDDANRRLQIWVNQSFLAVKEIKINDTLEYYQDHLQESLDEYNNANISLAVIPRIPKIILEYLVFTGIIAGAVMATMAGQPLAGMIPVIIFYAVVTRRLIPLVNNLVSGHLELTGALALIRTLQNEFSIIEKYNEPKKEGIQTFKKSIHLCGISFGYNDGVKTIDNVSLLIDRGSHIAIVGKTGSGKSTLLELICGLLDPVEGYFVADGVRLQNTRGLQHEIGYVPQQVFLIDESILSNITLKKTDMLTADERKWVQELAELCQITEFTDQLEKRLNARVGERGNNLSGGQVQRVGIARQLFKKPGLLILDEATAAVDDKIETKILKAIKNRLPDLTIIMVTHRKSSLKKVDQVILIDKGRVVRTEDSEIILEGVLESIDSQKQQDGVVLTGLESTY